MLKWLATDIVESILKGTQPRDLTAERIRQIKTIDEDTDNRLNIF